MIADVARRKPKPVPTFTPAELRAIRGTMTQAQAAAMVGVTRTTWAFWELGTREPSLQSRMLIDLLRRGKIR